MGIRDGAKGTAEAAIRVAGAAAPASVQRIENLQWPGFKAPVSD